MVLVSGTTSVEVTYVATFDQKTQLPSQLDKTMWYPFSPATKEGSYDPLPSIIGGKAQWASLRTKQTITANPVCSSNATWLNIEIDKAIMKGGEAF